MYISIQSIDNGYLVSFTKWLKPLHAYDMGTRVERYYATIEAVQTDLPALVIEATR